MKYKNFIYLVFMPFIGFAQETPSLTQNLELKLALGQNALNINYEQPVSTKVIWDVGASINGFYLAEDDDASKNNFGLTTNIKYIYNRDKRARKNKSLENNAGNYIKGGFNYSINRNVFIPNFMWGTKTNLDENFSFFAEVGIATNHELLIPFNVGFTYSIPVFKKK